MIRRTSRHQAGLALDAPEHTIDAKVSKRESPAGSKGELGITHPLAQLEIRSITDQDTLEPTITMICRRSFFGPVSCSGIERLRWVTSMTEILAWSIPERKWAYKASSHAGADRIRHADMAITLSESLESRGREKIS